MYTKKLEMISLILSPTCIYIDSQDLAALKVQLRRVKQIKLFLLQTVREMPTYDMQVQHDKEYSKAKGIYRKDYFLREYIVL